VQQQLRASAEMDEALVLGAITFSPAGVIGPQAQQCIAGKIRRGAETTEAGNIC